jgi:molybdate transport system ATP-binding protein
MPAHLSGGEKQRVAIGRALLSSPELLLMDEPLASLDGARKDELLRYITMLSQSFALPILYVSHAPDEILRIAREMIFLDGGQVVASGPVEDVMSRADFAAAAGRSSRMTILSATVTGHDAPRGATLLALAAGPMVVPLLDHPVGSLVRLRIAADHVILARHAVPGLSVRNQLPGKILSLQPAGSMVDVVVDIGSPLYAEVTLDACQELGLREGAFITVLIISAAILAASVSLSPAGEERRD